MTVDAVAPAIGTVGAIGLIVGWLCGRYVEVRRANTLLRELRRLHRRLGSLSW